MRSMTGFGRVTAIEDGREAVLELKSVNHRFLDIAFRIPRALGFLEDSIKKALKARLKRGHVDVYLGYRNGREDAREVVLDEALARAYAGAFGKLGELTALPGDVGIAALAAMPDVLTAREKEEDREAVQHVVLTALDGALSELVLAREIEGERLAADIESRLCSMEALLLTVEGRMETAVAETMERIKARVEELLGQLPADPNRIAQEAALLADRSAIDEETVRLRSHIGAARAEMVKDEPAGRKLDFLVQEMHREVNTMGSKSQDMTITTAVLALKAEVEKIREQVQNIE